MVRTRCRDLSILCLALSVACGEAHPQGSGSATPTGDGQAKTSAADPTDDEDQPPFTAPAVILDEAGGVPSCSNGMGQPAQDRSELNLGSRFPRARWWFTAQIPHIPVRPQSEPSPPFEPPAPGTSFVVRSISRSDETVRCNLSDFVFGCVGGGSRLALEGTNGNVMLELHFEPKELAFIAPGARVILDADFEQGTLALKAQDGSLLLWIVQSGIRGGMSGYMARSYETGGLQIASGEDFCQFIDSRCNALDSVQSIVVDTGSSSTVIPPAGQALVDVEGRRYEVINHLAMQRRSQTCLAGFGNADAISVRYRPQAR